MSTRSGPWAVLGCVGLILLSSAGGARAAEPIDAADADALGRRLAQIVADGELASLGPLFDLESMGERTLEGLDVPAGLGSLLMADADPSGLFSDIVPFLLRGDSYRYVGARTIDGQPCLLFRLSGTVGLLYHGWCMQRGDDGVVRLVDLYNHGAGLWTSETIQEALLHDHPELAGSRAAERQELTGALEKLREALEAERYAEVEEIYQLLPPRLRERRLAMHIRMKAALHQDDSLYRQALREYVAAHPEDHSVAFKELERAMLSMRFTDALDHLDDIERRVGGDPFLNVSRAIPLLKLRRYEEAARRLDMYIETEDPTQQALIMRAIAAIGSRDFEGGVQWLQQWGETTGHSPFDVVDARRPHYEEFLASEAYQRWKSGAGAARSTPSSQGFRGGIRDLAEAIGKELESGSADLVTRHFDLPAFVERMVEGMPPGPDLDANLQEYLKGIMLPGQSLSVLMQQPGCRLKMLGVRTLEGEPSVILRATGHGFMGYFGLALRAGDETATVVDFYNHGMGQWMSEILHWHFTHQSATVAPGDDFQGMVHAKAYAQMMEAWTEGEFEQGMRLYVLLPESVRSNRTVLSSRLVASGPPGTDRYEQALEAILQHYPEDVGAYLALMDHTLERGDYEDTLTVIDLLDDVLEGDPYLHVCRARVLVRLGRAEKAMALVKSFQEQEEGGEEISDTWIVLGDGAVALGFFQLAAHCYERAEELRPGLRVEVWKGLENYEEFVSSEFYRRFRR